MTVKAPRARVPQYRPVAIGAAPYTGTLKACAATHTSCPRLFMATAKVYNPAAIRRNGGLTWNRTKNYRLGSDCYIRLTMKPLGPL